MYVIVHGKIEATNECVEIYYYMYALLNKQAIKPQQTICRVAKNRLVSAKCFALFCRGVMDTLSK